MTELKRLRDFCVFYYKVINDLIFRMDKLRGMSQSELQAMLDNEDKINEFVLESSNLQSLQQQRDSG